MGTQHTKGPWTWSRFWKRDTHDPIYDGSMGSLEPGILWAGGDGAEGIYCPSRGNALLIEAAPMLLEALQELLTYMGDWDDPTHETCVKARAAIARATK